jgi:hypothetical protein
MVTRKGNTAMRKVVLRATRALRHGAGRETTLLRPQPSRQALRHGRRQRSLRDARRRADLWLHAAGFRRIDALDEFTC